MKYLRLIDHNGIERHKFEVFVEGPDWEYSFPEPVALWFGKLQLVDKISGEAWSADELSEIVSAVKEEQREEVTSEPETTGAESSGDSGITSPDEPESLEVPSEPRARGDTPKRDKRDKRASKS